MSQTGGNICLASPADLAKDRPCFDTVHSFLLKTVAGRCIIRRTMAPRPLDERPTRPPRSDPRFGVFANVMRWHARSANSYLPMHATTDTTPLRVMATPTLETVPSANLSQPPVLNWLLVSRQKRKKGRPQPTRANG